LAVAGALAFALAAAPGCGSMSPNGQPKTFAQERGEQLEAERREFIAAHRDRLVEIDKEITPLEAKLRHESKSVDNQQRAEWSQDLFELKQEKQRLSAELDRAETATQEEWEEMRGSFELAVDALHSGVIRLRDEVATAFEVEERQAAAAPSEPQPLKLTTHGGMCPVDIRDVKADVKQQAGAVVVTLTTGDTESVADLRQRAKQLVSNGSYLPASSSAASDAQDDDSGGADAGAPKAPEAVASIAVNARFDNVPNGIRVIFVPKDKAQLDALEEQIKDDMEALGTGRCTTEPKTS
jgi:hypothetical protein